MDPDERRIEIVHGEPCNCRVDDKAIYIAAPCYVVGNRVTKHRIAQMIRSLKSRP